MGESCVLIVVDLFMEKLQVTIIATDLEEYKPRFWRRYVDAIIAMVTKGYVQPQQDHMNTVDKSQSIKFTKGEVDNI